METINASLIVAIVGLVLFIIGGRARFRAIMAHYRTKGGRLKTLYVSGKWSSIAGGALLVIGLYAGLFGPIALGSLRLPVFEYDFVDRMRADALPYAKTKLQLSGEPVVGWRGTTKKSFHMKVRNTGDRKVAYIVVKFSGAKGGASFEQKLNGPFAPGKSKDVYPRLRPGANLAYSSKATDSSFFTITQAKF